MISLNKFPSVFKLAKVKTIFKKGQKTNVSNHKPTPLLPIISKVIEKVVHEQTTKFLNDNNIFYYYQSAFRRNHSTDLFLLFLQNNCIRFCLELQCNEHISNEHYEHFNKLNWLPKNQKFKQCITSTVFIFVQNKYPGYMNEIFKPAENIRINMRNSYLKLNHPFRNDSGQNGLSYIGPAICNRIPAILKRIKNLNTFKHKMKHYYLTDLSNPNLWNVGGFDYALGIIKIIFLSIKQLFLHFFPVSL